MTTVSVPALDLQRADGPSFDIEVPSGGYAWWYVDALSDDGHQGLTIIAFVGSVFSPYYAWSGRADPLDHCTVNVVLYDRRGSRWAMTERRRPDVQRTATSFHVGPSALRWDGDALTIDVNERTYPFPSPLEGRVRVHPEAITSRRVALDPGRGHVWWPIAPRSRVEVELDEPSTRWSGHGYFDSNWGGTSLEEAFVDWNWSRVPTRDGSAVLYDVVRRDLDPLSVAVRFDRQGRDHDFEPPPVRRLPAGPIWRVPRATRAESTPVVRRTLEDTPFYTRSVLDTELLGERVEGVHESLSCDRFASNFVKFLLTFRMPRAKSLSIGTRLG